MTPLDEKSLKYQVVVVEQITKFTVRIIYSIRNGFLKVVLNCLKTVESVQKLSNIFYFLNISQHWKKNVLYIICMIRYLSKSKPNS